MNTNTSNFFKKQIIEIKIDKITIIALGYDLQCISYLNNIINKFYSSDRVGACCF